MTDKKDYKDMEKLKSWFEWMTNKDMKLGDITSKSPKLSKRKAFSILYSLQEYLGIVSDEVEMCEDCKNLLDMSSEGGIANEEYKEYGLARKPKEHEEGSYCEDCLRKRFGFT